MITLVVRNFAYHPRLGQIFEGSVNGRLITVSHQPLLDAARVLSSEGVDPRTVLTMRHEGQDHDALRTRVGHAAKLTVREASFGKRKPDFARWTPFTPRHGVAKD